MLPLIVTAAIVVEDGIFLRTAPEERAPHPVSLYKGDWLEVRGETRGYLQVYDHRHERAGYVVPSRVRKYVAEPAGAARLRAVIDFVRDSPGMESVGIAHVALFLKIAPPELIDAAIFDALGAMADRLARRASARGAIDPTLPEHLEIAKSYGLRFEVNEGRVCYDGEAFQRSLQLGGTIDERGAAVLALTDPRCHPRDPAATAILDQVDAIRLAPQIANQIRFRRVQAWAALAYAQARAGEDAKNAAERAIDELARADKSAFGEEDQKRYQEAAVLAATIRFAAEPARSSTRAKIETRETGQTCILDRCTYGVMWKASLRERDDQLAIQVSPLLGWTELWIFDGDRRTHTLIPAVTEPELGYVELAGWLPDGKRFLTAREAKVEGRITREFSIVAGETGATIKKIGAREFKRQAAAEWKAATLALR